MAACNTFEEKSVDTLLRDVEEAFEEFAKTIQRDREAKDAEIEVRAMLNAVQEILQSVWKALHGARQALKGKAGYVVEDVSSVYLDRAKLIRKTLGIEEPPDERKKEGNPENKPEEETKKRKKKDESPVRELQKGEEYRPITLAEMITLFRDVEQSYFEQVRKLDKALRDETDPAQMAIRKTIVNVLKKTRRLAHRSRPEKPTCM